MLEVYRVKCNGRLGERAAHFGVENGRTFECPLSEIMFQRGLEHGAGASGWPEFEGTAISTLACSSTCIGQLSNWEEIRWEQGRFQS